jgi:aminopeptidase N
MIFSFAAALNFIAAFFFITGAVSLKEKTQENVEEIADLSKKQFHYVIERTMTEFLSPDGEDLRKEDSTIVAYQNLFDVTYYDLSLSFDMTGKSIDGELTMTAEPLSDTLGLVYLNFYDNMKVNEVKYTRNAVEDKTFETAVDADFKREKDYVIVELKDKPSKGLAFSMKIKYSGTPKTLGFDSFSFKTIYGNPTAYNLSEPNYGPTWWPSKDRPNDKALSTVRLTVPAGFTGVSNGLLSGTTQNTDGTTTFVWMNSYPIATYLVSVVVAKFAHWEDTYTSVDGNKTMPVVYYVYPRDSANARIDWKETPEMIALYAKTFGEYPFINEKYGMAQFGWTSGAMEHQTLTSMGYLLITGDARYEHVVAHELAHHWWGDCVTLENWDNIWLNEGFASYCEALWEEQKRGIQAYFDYMKKQDYGYFSGTVYAPEAFINDYRVYATVYLKGSWVLHMLRGVMGDELFFKTLREYYDRFKYSNANTEQFVTVAEEIYGQPLDWFFDEWVYKGTGRPKYEYSWRFENFQDQPNSGAYTVRLQLKQVQTDYDVYKMPIRVTIITEAGDREFTVFNDTKEQSFLLTVDSKPKEIKLDRDGWILKKVAKGKYEG